MRKNTFTPIAVVGVGALFAKANNVREYWKNIVEQRDLITEVPNSHWLIEDYFEPDIVKANQQDKIYNKWGSFIDEIPFDPIAYGTPPSTLPAIDTSQLLALIVAKQVLNDVSQNNITQLDLSRTSVILGTSVLEAIQYLSARIQRPIWAKALQGIGLSSDLINEACDRIANAYPKWQEDSFPGLLSNVVAGRVANRFNCGGTNCTTDAACASSLSAISMAINELQLGLADMAITGGVDTLNDLIMYKCFSIVTALSPSGQCRPFSDQADGTILGEGIGLFAFKRLEDAEKSNNHIYGVIRGIGTSSDGRAKSIYAPSASAQSRAVLKAYEQAGYGIETVGLIEAHGTGTIAGDLAEYQGLIAAFAASHEKKSPQSCALGSVKSQIGHTKSAAGAAGLLKVLFALQHKILPATINAEKINPNFHQDTSPLYLNTKTRPWITGLNPPRRAGVSCFGFGGSNFHLTVEEYVNKKHQAKRLRVFAAELIVIATKNYGELLQKICTINQPDYLAQGLLFIAYESQKTLLDEYPYRLAIIAHNIDELSYKLHQAFVVLQKQTQFTSALSIDKDIYYGYVKETPKTAFCFPDQDSPYLYMADDILMGFEEAIAVWEQFATEPWADGLTIAEIVYPPLSFELENQNRLTTRLKQPDFAKPALAAASLSWLALLNILRITPNCVIGNGFGEMIALSAADVFDLSTLFLIAKTCQDQKTLIKFLKNTQFNAPKIPVYTSLKNELYSNKTNKSTQALALHAINALRFSQSVRNMYQQGIRIFIEVGPGQTLSPLIREALSHVNDYHVISVDQALYTDQPCSRAQNAMTDFWRALGQMICCGINPELLATWSAYTAPQSEQPPTKLGHTLNIKGTNYQKPYPKQDAAGLSKEHPINLNLYSKNSKKGSNAMNDESKKNMQGELQRQLIDAQTHYQRIMNESHIAFLETIAKISGQTNPSLANIAALNVPSSLSTTNVPSPALAEMLNHPSEPSAPLSFSSFTQPKMSFDPHLENNEISVKTPSNTSKDIPQSEFDIKAFMMNVVVEKTGYPLEMLREDMDIEADLGIDSIKRVEILSALRESIPELPEMDAGELAALKTLSDISSYLEKHSINPITQHLSEKKNETILI